MIRYYSFLYLFIFIYLFNFSYHAICSNNNRTIETIPVPYGFNRILVQQTSFASWLRNLPLKSPGSSVLDYRGKVYKNGNDSTVAAVVDWEIFGRRMEQCMDILIHFYAEYLRQNSRENEIIFPLPGGYWLGWKDWKKGWRPIFRGINMTMRKCATHDSSQNAFTSYLHTIFAESHTQQFYHGYKPIDRHNVKIGDFIVRKGSKSHAVMIMDLAINEKEQLIALIGHGDTPACQFYLFNYQKNNPWFPLNFENDHLTLPIRKKMKWDGLRRF